MFAIVSIAGQQFKVEEGQELFVHQLEAEEGDSVSFDQVHLIDNAGDIWKACEELGWVSKPTAANRPVHNPCGERNIKTVIIDAKCNVE